MLQNMLTAAVVCGYNIQVICDGEEDYHGVNIADAMDAIEAVDEANVYVLEQTDDGDEVEGWAFIVNDLDDDERIADCSGWVGRWMDEQ